MKAHSIRRRSTVYYNRTRFFLTLYATTNYFLTFNTVTARIDIAIKTHLAAVWVAFVMTPRVVCGLAVHRTIQQPVVVVAFDSRSHGEPSIWPQRLDVDEDATAVALGERQRIRFVPSERRQLTTVRILINVKFDFEALILKTLNDAAHAIDGTNSPSRRQKKARRSSFLAENNDHA